jgi:site-specific DNA-methyltransferase (adenine-specific)
MNVHHRHTSDEWETPVEIFDDLNAEFGPFDLDVSATIANTKGPSFLSAADDGLSHAWKERNWCNPPYSQLRKWVAKAAGERAKGNLTVMLIPARTDTAAFHDYIYNKPGVDVRFLRLRLKFGGAKGEAPFPSMTVIFHPAHRGVPQPFLNAPMSSLPW